MQKQNSSIIIYLLGIILVIVMAGSLAATFLKRDYRIDLKALKQSDDSRCGEACIMMVLNYYGIEILDETIVLARTNHTYELGSDDEGIKRAIESFGLNCEIKNNATFEDLEEQLSQGRPVIVDWLSDFEGYQRYGHSSIVVDLDSTHIYLMDPYIAEVRAIERSEFETVWFDWKKTPRITCENMVVCRVVLA